MYSIIALFNTNLRVSARCDDACIEAVCPSVDFDGTARTYNAVGYPLGIKVCGV